MATEFNIPGLEQSIKKIAKLREETAKAALEFLNVAINGEKAMRAIDSGGLKTYIETQKKAKTETDKLEVAKEKLIKLQTQEAKEIAKVNIQIQEQISKNKILAAAENENATALQKLNAKISEQTKLSKELGAQMALLALEGKKNTAEFRELEQQFTKAAASSKQLNDTYREISKSSGDNRALVGSYSQELEGHFKSLNDGFMSLKGNLQSGNIGGTFSDARSIVIGFGQALKQSNTDASGVNDELGKTTGVFGAIKNKVVDTTKSTAEFFKPNEKYTKQMSEGLEKVKIGFTKNNEAVNILKESQAQANGVASNTNAINEKGGILSNIFARGQVALSGATGIASGAFNILKIAIASTGVGLLVIIIAALINYLMKLDPVIDKIEQVFAGFGGVIDFISEKIGSFIEGIESVGDLMSKLGDILSDPIGSVKELANGMKDAAIAAAELKARQQDLADQMDIASLKNKVQESEIAQLMIQAKDRTKTEKERQDAFEKAERLNEEIFNRNKRNSAEGLAIAITEAAKKKKLTQEMIEDLKKLDIERANSLLNEGKISIAAYDMLKEAFDKEIEIRNQYNERLDKITTKKNNDAEKAEAAAEARRKRAEDAAKKALEDERKRAEMAINIMKITLDNKIANYDQAQKSDEENIAFVQAVSLTRIQIAEAELKKNLIGITKGTLDEQLIRQSHSLELQKIEREKSKALNKINSDRAKFELELYELNNKSLLDDAKDLTDLLIAEEKRRLQESLDVHKAYMRQELQIDQDKSDEKLKILAKSNAQLTANELKYLQYILKEEEKKDKAVKKADSDLLNYKVQNIEKELKTNDRKYKLLNKGAIQNSLNEIKLEDKKLQELRILYKDNAEKLEDIDLAIAENKQKLDTLVKNNKISALQQGLATFIEIVGQESALGKAAAIAQTTINTIEGATRAYRDYIAPYSFVVAGLVAAQGAMQIAKIAGVQAFEKGTLFAPYTGKAVVDEAGPELHFDKNFNLKSEGKKGGARVTDIVQGDKIIPADVSAVIRKYMLASYGVKESKSTTIDYAEMGKYFDKSATRIVSAINNKKDASLNVIIQKDLRLRATFKGKQT